MPCYPAGTVSLVLGTTNIASLICIQAVVNFQDLLTSVALPAPLAVVAGRDEIVFLLVEE